MKYVTMILAMVAFVLSEIFEKEKRDEQIEPKKKKAKRITPGKKSLFPLKKLTLFAKIMLGVGVALSLFSIYQTWRDEVNAEKKYEKESENFQSIIESQKVQLETVTGGTTFCYWMLYNFSLKENAAYDLVLIKEGKQPLYNVNMRITELGKMQDVFTKDWGEINSAAVFIPRAKWILPDSVYYRIFFTARNGNWTQDLILIKSAKDSAWLPATRVKDRNGQIMFKDVKYFPRKYEEISWHN